MLILGSRARAEPLDSRSTTLTLPPQPGLLPHAPPGPAPRSQGSGEGWSWLLPQALKQAGRRPAEATPRAVISAPGLSLGGGGS